MSFQAMAWASEQTTGSATRKSVLYALANHSNKYGRCTLLIETICQEAELGPTAVKSALREMDKKFLTRTRRRKEGGELGCYDFQLLLPETRDDQKEPTLESRGVSTPESLGVSQEPGTSLEPGKPLQAAPAEKKRNIVWDCLVDAGFSKPATPSERGDFGKTASELRGVIPETASAEDIVKAIRARKLAWEREYPDAKFTHRVLRGKWAELGALAGLKGASNHSAVPAGLGLPDHMLEPGPEYQAWHRTATPEERIDYQMRFNTGDNGYPW